MMLMLPKKARASSGNHGHVSWKLRLDFQASKEKPRRHPAMPTGLCVLLLSRREPNIERPISFRRIRAFFMTKV
jgi:hypothetical protein